MKTASNAVDKEFAEEIKRLAKLEGMVERLKRGKNVQDRQIQTWLSQD